MLKSTLKKNEKSINKYVVCNSYCFDNSYKIMHKTFEHKKINKYMEY